VTPAHWRGTRVVSQLGPVCPQNTPTYGTADGTERPAEQLPRARLEYIKRLTPYMRNQSEDCLYLNIYAPFSAKASEETLSKRKLPILLFIHGESLYFGSGNVYDGTLLAAFGEIIVITINYRLGIFGFLPTDDGKRGNFGLMDVIAALHWLQDNVEEGIGGDPNNITLVGHGRGSDFVNFLLISPLAKGLFSKAVLMSGSAMHPLSLTKGDPNVYARYLAKAVNCPNYDSSVLVDCLRTKSVEELLKVESNHNKDAFDLSLGLIIDGLAIPADPRLVTVASPNDSIHSLQHHLDPVYHTARQYNSQSSSKRPHPLLFGVTRIESPFALFTDQEERFGIDIGE